MAALLLSACSSSGGQQAAAASSPVATSVSTPLGSFATLPMGDLSQPLDTFWQLLVRPAGAARWTDEAQSVGVATNGGLLLVPTAASLLVAARPSNLLGFTPIQGTTDAGRHWAPSGLVPIAVAAGPSALAASAPGRLAVVANGTKVLEQATPGAAWSTLTTLESLRAVSTGCHPSAITAVAWIAGAPAVGLACRQPGATPVVIRSDSGWAAPAPGPGGGAATVLAFDSSGGSASALVSMQSTHGATVVIYRRAGTGWASGVPVKGPGPLEAFGTAVGSGWFALFRGPTSQPTLYLNSGPTSAWHMLPAPPAGTVTVATGDQYVDAMAVDPSGTVLTVWALSPSRTAWAVSQTIKVPISFGSSG